MVDQGQFNGLDQKLEATSYENLLHEQFTFCEECQLFLEFDVKLVKFD